MCDTFRPMFPTKAAMAFDDLAYPQSWEGEHFPVSLDQHHADGAHRKPSAQAKGKSKSKPAAKSKAPAKGKSAKPAKDVGSTWQ
jgi:hypothetical protein